MKYYCVVTTVDNNGRVTCSQCGCVDADEIPSDRFVSNRKSDVYYDWFDSLEAALEFVSESKYA